MLNIVENAEIDFRFNKRRLCDCGCLFCSQRDKHPIMNCRDSCMSSEQAVLQDYIVDEEEKRNCECDCDFCSSSVTVHVHKKLDCKMFCEYSDIQQEDADV